jgi:hypothetical protein
VDEISYGRRKEFLTVAQKLAAIQRNNRTLYRAYLLKETSGRSTTP